LHLKNSAKMQIFQRRIQVSYFKLIQNLQTNNLQQLNQSKKLDISSYQCY